MLDGPLSIGMTPRHIAHCSWFNEHETSMERRRSFGRRGSYTKTLEDFFLSKTRYPPKEDKERLSQETGLSFAQVNTWFNNRRKKEQYDRQFNDSEGSSGQPAQIPHRPTGRG